MNTYELLADLNLEDTTPYKFPPRKLVKYRNYAMTYCLRFNTGGIYFGQTTQPMRRYYQHKNTKPPHRFLVVAIGSPDYVRDLETRLLQKFKDSPRLVNKVFNEYKTYQKGPPSLLQQCKDLGLAYHTIRDRMKKGETFEQAQQERRRKYALEVAYQGKLWSVYQLAKHVGVSYQTLINRFDRGLTVEQAVKK